MKTIFITGATDGIGKQATIDLSGAGNKIIAHGRNRERLEVLKEEILVSNPNADIQTVLADFEDLKQISLMCDEIIRTNNKIDVLFNNAASYFENKEFSVNGLEKNFQVNHLSYVLVAEKLSNLLKNSEQGRIINVSSMIHAVKIDFDDLQGEKSYSGRSNYALSKLLNILHANKLARNFEGTNITSHALHPGVIETKLLNSAFKGGLPVSEGSKTFVYLANEDAAGQLTGQYFENNRPMRSNPVSYDTDVQDKLQEISISLIKNYL